MHAKQPLKLSNHDPQNLNLAKPIRYNRFVFDYCPSLDKSNLTCKCVLCPATFSTQPPPFWVLVSVVWRSPLSGPPALWWAGPDPRKFHQNRHLQFFSPPKNKEMRFLFNSNTINCNRNKEALVQYCLVNLRCYSNNWSSGKDSSSLRCCHISTTYFIFLCMSTLSLY